MNNQYSTRSVPAGDIICGDTMNLVQNAFVVKEINFEPAARLAAKGIYPLLTGVGYVYLKDTHGRILGTANVVPGIRAPKPDEQLTKLEKQQLKLFGLL